MEIRLHSSKKHRALGYYLSIIRNLILSKNTPFNELYYADLFCGDGKCTVTQIGKSYEPPIIQSVLKPAKEKGIALHCFLNDLEKIELMKENTKDYSKFIELYGGEDANTFYKKVLQRIPKDQFSIFFLDPTNHSQLKWTTIKEISQHTHTYDGSQGMQTRRPELIINFMTYTMLQSFRANSYDSITESLGTDDWIKKINENKKSRIERPVESALLYTFTKQLESLGYKVPRPIEILNTDPPNTVYYLIWSTNEKGYDIIEKRVIPWLVKLMKTAQKENKTELKRANARKNGIRPLIEYYNNSNL